MATGLEILSGVVCAIDTLEKIYEYARWAHERYKKYKHAPEDVRELQEFLNAMLEGGMQYQLERTRQILSLHDKKSNRVAKNRLAELLKKLQKELITTEKCLGKCFNGDGTLKRRRYALWYQPKLEQQTEDLTRWRTEFYSELNYIVIDKGLPSPTLLESPDPFSPVPVTWKQPIETGCLLHHGKADFTEEGVTKRISVFVEPLLPLGPDEKPLGLQMTDQAALEAQRKAMEQQASQVAEALAAILRSGGRGIPMSLGYRNEPSIELVFQYPDGFYTPHSLRWIMNHVCGRTHFEIAAPVDFRVRVARDIIAAVYTLCLAGFVHKNLRPDSFLYFSSDESTAKTDQISPAILTRLSTAYLVNWRMSRRLELNSWFAGNVDWAHNFYRHIKRQGEDLQEKYGVLHDVYSLGVCLLEVGLWESFVVVNSDTDGRIVSSLSLFFLEAAKDYAATPESVFGGDDPNIGEEERNKNMNAFLSSGKIRKVFTDIAKALLPGRMGEQYRDLVVHCLNNDQEEDNFQGELNPFEGIGAGPSENFRRLILEAKIVPETEKEASRC